MKKNDPAPGRIEHGVLADPPEPGTLRELALGDRTVVGVGMRDTGAVVVEHVGQRGRAG